MMKECVDRMMEDMEYVMSHKSAILNVKVLSTAFTIDTIAMTSFATQTKEKDRFEPTAKRSQFIINACSLMNVNPLAVLCFISMPLWFNNLVGVRIHVNPKPVDFFMSLARELIKQRKASGTRRLDLLQFLMDTAVNQDEIDKLNYNQLTANTEVDSKC